MMRRATGVGLAALLCWQLACAANLEATVVTTSGKALEDAAVVLEPVAGVPTRVQRKVSVEQRDRDFIPYVTVVQTGTLVEFPNHDAFKHHVYSFSPAKTFEIKLYGGKPAQPVLFDKAGEVAVGCNIHDWMEAYVLVVDSPYFAKTGRDGHALVRNVPPGHYRLRVWHPRQLAQVERRDLELTASAEPLRLEVAIDAPARVAKPKPPVETSRY